MKGGIVMATSTFNKNFVIKDSAAQKKVLDLLSSDKPVHKISKPSFEEVERSEQLLKQVCSRLKD